MDLPKDVETWGDVVDRCLDDWPTDLEIAFRMTVTGRSGPSTPRRKGERGSFFNVGQRDPVHVRTYERLIAEDAAFVLRAVASALFGWLP